MTPSGQAGVALPAALTLMLVLALLAVGNLESTRLDLVTAHSLREHRAAFELAEAGVAAGLAALPASAGHAPPCVDGPGLPVPVPAGGTGEAVAWLCRVGSTPALAGAASLERLTLWHYEIIAEGRQGNARSRHRQGAWLVAPAAELAP